MSERYPYNELEVFVAGYERGRRFARQDRQPVELEHLEAEEIASRRLTLFDVTREGLLMLGMEAEFVPRRIYDEGVRRGLVETT